MNKLDSDAESKLKAYINQKYDYIRRFGYEFYGDNNIFLYSEHDIKDIEVNDEDVDFIENLLNANFIGLISLKGKHGFLYQIK